MKRANHRVWGIVATIVVIAALVHGFLIIGTPEQRRLERVDEHRVNDLQAIVRAMQDLTWDVDARRLKRPLLDSLQLLRNEARVRRPDIVDPVTGEPYGFRVLDEHRFELCADFDLARDEAHEAFWNHPEGSHCWTIDVRDPP